MPLTVDQETRKKANAYFFTKVVANVLLIVIGAVLIALFLRQMQTQSAYVKQERNSRLALLEAIQLLEENADSAEELTQMFHKSNQDVLADLKTLFDSGSLEGLAMLDVQSRSLAFSDFVTRAGVDYLFLMNMDSKVVLAPHESLYGINPAALGLLTQENINRILKGTLGEDGSISPVLVSNHYGTYYFYSSPYVYLGTEYMLVLGANSDVLNVQLSSLTDVSVVLSRSAVANGGFLFAVDKLDNSFLYYANGRDVLTGQNALSTGLSQDALSDGYAGVETIKGVRYYCVSKEYGNTTVVCAVAQTENIVSSDRYVLFWSILGFILVMILCLAYAVVVRNDFVRREVKTDRVILNPRSKNPTIFDRSIFRKVIPLMLAGVIVMFCISFYTQTLLEITEGIDKSKIALEDVSARYNEGLESRSVIQDYYNSRFLSKARLISALIQEDPSVLNEASDLYHTYYDDYGTKVFIKDDEGNPLKSISRSVRLQELCESNGIDSIYVFDEDGHTIATNTANWYFAISHNEEDQSYPFRQVLDGKADSYVQEVMTDDLGNNSQYVGVVFRYFTAKDENGDTKYISNGDYEMTVNGVETAVSGKITPHRSMLQLGLNEEYSQKLMESTDVGTILSTNMLEGGFIVMFDNTPEHGCVYSPNESSIGKTAHELGISDKAFSGENYYGFSHVNGVSYFLYVHYSDGYYIATALPKSMMFQSRGIISAVTAVTCLVLILFLSGTVTLTNKEEERLYAVMSDAQAEKGLDSAIFNVILPSGRTAATTKAAARWDNRWIPWGERSPEQKLMLMISVVGGVLVMYITLSVIGVDRFFDKDSIVRYIISDAWDRGRNIFAFSACALVLIGTGILVLLIRIPVRIMTSLLGTRGETIGHLLLSVAKYGGVIGAFFYCLYLIGINSSSLLASAGILSLVIGLGAQSLIKDIIAGIFIVFEGEFRVGDIVTINDYRGTVLDIGLRTTKIMGIDGNIKILNNSDISGVLNMTQEASYAICDISIEYGQDIEYVEEVLSRELPVLKEKNPKILEGPVYAGVESLGDSGVLLKIYCKCNEADILTVTRYLNREVLQIFYRNDINVPFNNVTISELKVDGRKTASDLAPGRSEGEQND